MFLMLYFMLDGLILLCQSDFCSKNVMVFEGGFFGGTQNIWGSPYLNSTTILFDTVDPALSEPWLSKYLDYPDTKSDCSIRVSCH